MKIILKEIIIYIILLVVLALIQHNDLLTNPMGRLDNLLHGPQSILHPFLWSGGLYVFVGIVRIIVHYFAKLVILMKK